MDLRDRILDKIIERASEIFREKASDMNEGTRFIEDMHAKSVNYIQLIAVLEDNFDVEINFMAFRRRMTFGEAADFVAKLCSEWDTE